MSKAVIHSPESTVTSLLASSGHLKSSVYTDSSHSSIKYNDKHYESASEALDAYIEDFEKSLGSSWKSTGRLHLKRNTVSHPRAQFKNRDVLKESLSERELDFLNLPVGRSIANDPDLVSLITDDLLVLPPDGSLPITRTSALLTMSKRDTQLSVDCSPHSKSYSRSYNDPASSHVYIASKASAPQELDLHVQRRRKSGRNTSLENIFGSHSSHQSHKAECSQPLQHILSTPLPSQNCKQKKSEPNTSSAKNYPRWLTCQKSEIDFSGITSLPDVKYPGWLQDCDLASNISHTLASKPKTEGYSLGQELRSEPTIVSCFDDLEASYCDLQKENLANLLRLNDNVYRSTMITKRKQQTKQLATVEVDKKNNYKESFRGKTGLLATLNLELPLATPVIDLFSLCSKPPVPVGGAELLEPDGAARDKLIDDYLTDCIKTNKETVTRASGYSSSKHHGPVEALKQMLFSLQSVEQHFNQEQTGQHEEITAIKQV
ncbi:LAS2 protein, partial [Polyodon spathula]|nr:LAS2 protein [Polyodon spathula]